MIHELNVSDLEKEQIILETGAAYIEGVIASNRGVTTHKGE